MKRLKQNHSGAAALILVITLSILFITTTLIASRLSITEIRQATNIDSSDQAYFAAEAGIEEALQRLENNPDIEINKLFPEQYNALNDLVGDEAVLVNSAGQRVDNIDINTFNESDDEIGLLAWRNRRVYVSQVNPSGTQVKDESIEVDTSDLRRILSTRTCGQDGNDCDNAPIQSRFRGVKYCWVPVPGGERPDIELTTLSWDKANIADVAVTKTKVLSTSVGSTTNLRSGNVDIGVVIKEPGFGSNGYCFRFEKTNNSQDSRRYILRTRPLFPSVVSGDQNQYLVEYKVSLLDKASPYPASTLQIADNAILIDVTGQDGDIKRRLVVKKERHGKVLGIFDFVLYSGDPTLPLCKAGVQQSNPGTYDAQCSAIPLSN